MLHPDDQQLLDRHHTPPPLSPCWGALVILVALLAIGLSCGSVALSHNASTPDRIICGCISAFYLTVLAGLLVGAVRRARE
jgi:hypothetical protein